MAISQIDLVRIFKCQHICLTLFVQKFMKDALSSKVVGVISLSKFSQFKLLNSLLY